MILGRKGSFVCPALWCSFVQMLDVSRGIFENPMLLIGSDFHIWSDGVKSTLKTIGIAIPDTCNLSMLRNGNIRSA